MPKSTTPNRRKWNRRQLVAYYREWPAGSNHDSVATQKQIIATWAAENGYEIVEEVIDRHPVPLPANCYFEVGGMIQEHATKRGDTLYVRKMDAHTLASVATQ